MNHVTRLLSASLLLCGAAAAQSFNVDMGILNPAPSAALGAGGSQPGFWNPRDGSVATPIALTDVSGVVTTVTLARTAGGGGNISSNNANTTGDDELLMDDGQFPSSTTGATWTVAGLAAGTYTVYTYAWAPDNAAYLTNVSVNGGPGTNVGGLPFTGYSVPNTHALDTVTVAAGGSINIALTKALSPPAPTTNFATFNGFQIKLEATTTTSFCDGSAVGTACVACGNNGAAGNGCANSSFSAGAHLSASGTAGASAGSDTLVLTCTNMTGPGLFFQASGVAASPVSFGDGELCAASGIVRLGVVFPGAPSPADTAAYPGGITPNPIHIAGGPLVAGDIRHYQCWYRDAVSFCTTGTFNLSQGVTLTWGP